MLHRIRTLTILALGALCLSIGATASAQDGPAGRYLEAKHQEVRRLMAREATTPEARTRKNAEITTVLSALLDFESVSRAALGRHWADQSRSARHEFVELLQTLVERNYQSQLDNTSQYSIRYESETAEGEFVIVKTSARSLENRRAPAVSIEYKMRQRGNGWVVEDVVTDGVSMVDNYRGQFDRIIRRDGWEGLLQRMRTRVEQDNG